MPRTVRERATRIGHASARARRLLALACLLLVPLDLPAITGPHDYTLWRLGGTDADQTSANALRRALCEADHTEIAHVHATLRSDSPPITYFVPGDRFDPARTQIRGTDLSLQFQPVDPSIPTPQRLLPGDVILLGDRISGMIGPNLTVEYYLPPARRADQRLAPADLAGSPDLMGPTNAPTLEDLFAMPEPIQSQKTGRFPILLIPYVKERGWTVSHPFLGERVEVWRKIPGVPGKDPARYADPALAARDVARQSRIAIESATVSPGRTPREPVTFALAFRVEGEGLPSVFHGQISGVVRGPKGFTKILPPREEVRLEGPTPGMRAAYLGRFPDPGPYSWYIQIEVQGCDIARDKIDFEIVPQTGSTSPPPP